jgi:hypothetical protein
MKMDLIMEEKAARGAAEPRQAQNGSVSHRN